MKSRFDYRLAVESDLPAIVEMLADDELGAAREDFQTPLPQSYLAAFRKIVNDENQELTVVELDGQIGATFHLSFIQYLTYRGGIRAQIEAVRVKSGMRGTGIGKEVFQYAIQRAKDKGAHLVQLTTDQKRPDALRFYQQLGFVNSHNGMKLHL
jgi:GNAT superfamily N-acetyltransferase